MSEQAEMIKMSNVNFTYANGTVGVEEVDLDIKKGEVILLCGGSGCGKTTLTKIVNGIIPHHQGGSLTGIPCLFRAVKSKDLR